MIIRQKMKYLKIKLFVVLTLSVFTLPFNTQTAFSQQQNIPTQDELTRLGVQAYEQGNPVECLEYLRQATEYYSDDIAVWLNYGSFAYQIALELKRQSAEEDIWKKLSVVAIDALTKTVMIGKDWETDDPNVPKATGHAAFMIGDLWHYLYDKPELARDYFEFAKQYWPDDPDLIRELKKINRKIDPKYVPQPLNFYKITLPGGEK